MDYGKLLKKERQKCGVSVVQLAQMTGITKRAILYWENGERTMSVNNADKVFKALEVSVVIGKTFPNGTIVYPIATEGKERKLKIGDKEYSEILVVDREKNLLASITDENIIEENDCKVVCVPDQS